MYTINIDSITNDSDYIKSQGGADIMVEKAVKWLNDHGFECVGTSNLGYIGLHDEYDADLQEELWEKMLNELFPD